ncbi:hypothetical protein [Deinococcus sp.]|uniref:hypothetical protein n=1 Tax=Deinococcus sp. TaxID=47478 RepID=UPI003B5BC9E5
MFVLKVLWAIVKTCLYVLEAIFTTLDKSGKEANAQADAALSQSDEPPFRDRNSVYYDGPGRRP